MVFEDFGNELLPEEGCKARYGIIMYVILRTGTLGIEWSPSMMIDQCVFEPGLQITPLKIEENTEDTDYPETEKIQKSAEDINAFFNKMPCLSFPEVITGIPGLSSIFVYTRLFTGPFELQIGNRKLACPLAIGAAIKVIKYNYASISSNPSDKNKQTESPGILDVSKFNKWAEKK